MPSIRVKGQLYPSLEAAISTNDDTSCLRAELPSSPNIYPYTSSVRPKLSLPLLPRGVLDVTSSPSHSRPRSATTSSRIHAYCINTSRNSQLLEPPPNPLININSTPTSNVDNETTSQEVMIIGGIQSDVRVPSHVDDENHRRSGYFDHHHDDVVEHLDVIDSQIGTVSSLTNAANAIMIPPSSWYSRKPAVTLSPIPRLNNGTDQFEDSLDRHVNDVLESPSKLRRMMMGVWSFLKTPMGIMTGIYGFLVVFWGAAIVIFLAKIINFHNSNTQGFWVEVSSQVETGLFTVTSIGLIPWRVLDTYRIWKIWRYKRKTMELRAKAGLSQLLDMDDLPDPIYDPNYVHVLTETEQKDLHRQQRKFQHSQTWYRAHGTETHRAFPINTALCICFMNDGNSIFQIFLCGTMWGLNRFQRPPWSTGILIPASFLCGIAAAVLIWRGGENTKRVEEVKSRLRAILAEKHPLDGNLPQNLTRIPRPEVDSQTAMLTNISEKDINHCAIFVDEQEDMLSGG
ncbi:hypothetical protein BYT27DRAFT_7182981 [Phlegmacium glaucopus]|nr:hypothetical protein BYT27DRAFT_7182981 [Phlegmacium glaucopus]